MADDQIQEQTERLTKKIETNFKMLDIKEKESAQTEKLTKKIETKFKMLDIKEKESATTIKRGKIRELEKPANKLETLVEDIQDLKGKVQELMLECDKEIDEVNESTSKIEGELEKHGQPLENLQELLKEL